MARSSPSRSISPNGATRSPSAGWWMRSSTHSTGSIADTEVRVAILTGAGAGVFLRRRPAGDGGRGGSTGAPTGAYAALLQARHPAHPARLRAAGRADHRRGERGGDRCRARSRLHVRHPHRRRERAFCGEFRESRPDRRRRRRLAAAARGRVFQGLRDGVHRRHAGCRRSFVVRPGLPRGAGWRTDGDCSRARRAHRRQPAARGPDDQAAAARRPP